MHLASDTDVVGEASNRSVVCSRARFRRLQRNEGEAMDRGTGQQ